MTAFVETKWWNWENGSKLAKFSVSNHKISISNIKPTLKRARIIGDSYDSVVHMYTFKSAVSQLFITIFFI